MKRAKLFFSPLRREKSRRDDTLLTVCFSLRAFSLRTIHLPALMFFFCASLHAQVTIGGLEEPKAGAILDLNSTTKGGLLLSNVSIEDFFKIPSTFHGGGGEGTALKAGLTGAMIYNTNPAFCIGIHVWNGQHWGRIATTTLVPAPGALSITSDPNTLFGEETVEFAADPNAKTCKWFASKNGAPYEYLGITTSSTYTETFPVGVGKMKVIMDDCRSLKESEVSFRMNCVSPSFGSLTGGNYIYIYGDFPYAATGEYVQNGLVAHYDGINNTGEGDKYHSTSTVAWKNLVESEDEPEALPDGEMCLTGNCNTKGQNYNLNWTANSAYFSSTNNAAWFRINKFYNPLSYTLEVAYSSSTAATATQEQTLIANWELGGFGFALGTVWGTQHAGFATYVNGAYRYTNGMSYDLDEIQSLSAQYLDNGSSGCAVAIYVNGTGDIKPVLSSTCIPTPPKNNTEIWAIAANPIGTTVNGNFLQDGHIYSARIYNRPLDEDEIKQNSDLDKIRYIAPPTVMIGGTACTEVVVLSEHLLKCKVPAGDAMERKNVVINGGAIIYSDAYEYVNPANDFYISEIFPIIGVAGATLTLRGNKLNEITEVMVGGKICTNPSYDTLTDTYTCTLPDNPAGETNITITADSKVYLFAKVFEYR